MSPICTHFEGAEKLGHIDGFAPNISLTRVDLFYGALKGIKGLMHRGIAAQYTKAPLFKVLQSIKSLSIKLHRTEQKQ